MRTHRKTNPRSPRRLAFGYFTHTDPRGWLLAVLLGACSRRAQPPNRRVIVDSGVLSPWRAAPAHGSLLRVSSGRYLAGALRWTDAREGLGPRPATALTASAETPRGWLFATADGAIWSARDFLGPLSPAGELPVQTAEPRRLAQHSVGALVALDRQGHAWLAEAGGGRRLPMESVLAAMAVSPGEILAVTEPGVLRVSIDAGVHFRAIPVPSGVALGVSLRDGVAVVETTAGDYRWRQGGFDALPEALRITPWLAVTAAQRARADALMADGRWMPAEASSVASRGDGTLTKVVGDFLVTIDGQSGLERSRIRAPGAHCALYSAQHSLRALCTHGAWARVLFAEDRADPSGWRALRDELAAEPMGDVAFDLRGSAWAVLAPCTQRPRPAPWSVCFTDELGVRHDLTLHAGAALRAMEGGIALALSATSAEIISARGVETLRLPGEASRVDGGWLDSGRVILWSRRAEVVTVSIGSRTNTGWSWNQHHAPEGSHMAVRSPGGALLHGARADALWHMNRQGGFTRVTDIVRGAASSRVIEDQGQTYCVGGFCRVGAGLTLTPSASFEPVLARSDEVPEVPSLRVERGVIQCVAGRRVPAAEIDHGVAVSGYAMGWELSGDRVRVRWEGETLRGEASGMVEPRSGGALRGFGVIGAREPAGWLERCDAQGCDHRLVTLEGTVALGLGRRRGGGVEVLLRAGGYLVRAEEIYNGANVVTLVALDGHGVEASRRSFVTLREGSFAHAGSLGARDGLWVEGVDGQLRFYVLDAADREGTALAIVASPGVGMAGCEPRSFPRGIIRRIVGVPQVSGEGWYVETGEWQQQEVLALVGNVLCTMSFLAGESRVEVEADGEEREPVRSLVIESQGGGRYTGRLWAGRTRADLECVQH